MILDCCFSGNATQPQNTLAVPSADVIDLTIGTGAFTMAASGMYQTARFEEETAAKPQTYFTKYLLDTIERGVRGHREDLRLGLIFDTTADALTRDHKPAPTKSTRHDAARFPLARNVAMPRARPAPSLRRFARSSAVVNDVTDMAAALTDPALGGFPRRTALSSRRTPRLSNSASLCCRQPKRLKISCCSTTPDMAS